MAPLQTSHTFYLLFRSCYGKVFFGEKRKRQWYGFRPSTLSWLTLLRIPFWQDLLRGLSLESWVFWAQESGSELSRQAGWQPLAWIPLRVTRISPKSPILFGPSGCFPCCHTGLYTESRSCRKSSVHGGGTPAPRSLGRPGHFGSKGAVLYNTKPSWEDPDISQWQLTYPSLSGYCNLSINPILNPYWKNKWL